MKMTPIIYARRKNLTNLINTRFGGSQSNFSSVTGISLSQIGQWLSAEDSPHLRNMSERSARKIEARASLPLGWLDQNHEENEADSEASYVGGVPARILIPVVGIAQLGENGWYEEALTVGSDGYIEHFSNDNDVYVLKVKGDSMFPAIRNNWYVVVEPNSPVVLGEYVAIALSDGRKMVKELLHKNSEEISLTSVNGGGRLTLPITEISSIHAVAAVVSPSKHKDL